jgi:hypothetical protein
MRAVKRVTASTTPSRPTNRLVLDIFSHVKLLKNKNVEPFQEETLIP